MSDPTTCNGNVEVLAIVVLKILSVVTEPTMR